MTAFSKTMAWLVAPLLAALCCGPVLAQTGRGTPAVAGVSSTRQFSGARPTAAGASLSGLQRGLAMFSADMGRSPSSAEGLGALLKAPAGAKNWRGPYISSNNWRAALSDPWGNLYRYAEVGSGRQAVHYISSNGPDGLPGTRDDLTIQF